jgi:hypothetical protein
MWSFEHSLIAPVSKQQVWAVWTDVEKWHEWDAGVTWAKLDTVFETGATCILKPKDGPKVRAVITRCDPLAGFTDESRLPLCRLVFDHQVVETPGGVRITHRATMAGPTTFLFRRLIGKHLERDMPTAMTRMVERAKTIQPDAVMVGRA